MVRIRRRRTYAGLLVMLLALIASPLQANADVAQNLLTGLVTLPTGSPLAQAHIRVFLMRQSPPVDRTQVLPIAEGVTNSAGQFSITVPYTADIEAAALENGDDLNFYAQVLGAVGTALGSTIYKGLINVTGNLDRAVEPVVVMPKDILIPTMFSVATPRAITSVIESFYSCSYYSRLLESSSPLVIVGEYHAYEDQTGSFSYGKKADSSLGVGYSEDGSNWSVSGDVQMSNSSSSAITFYRGPYFGKQLKSKFHYEKRYNQIYCDQFVSEWLSINPTAWEAGAYEGTDVSHHDGAENYTNVPASYRADFAPNTSFDRSTEKAYSYGAAVTVFGVSLRGRSGYSTNVKMHWNFGSQPWYHSLFGKDNNVNKATIVYSW